MTEFYFFFGKFVSESPIRTKKKETWNLCFSFFQAYESDEKKLLNFLHVVAKTAKNMFGYTDYQTQTGKLIGFIAKLQEVFVAEKFSWSTYCNELVMRVSLKYFLSFSVKMFPNKSWRMKLICSTRSEIWF